VNITAYIERDIETGLYVGIVPGIPGAHTQAETLDELQAISRKSWNSAWKRYSP
jgi:predicted RNase H-like HicB family nuclease